MSESTSTDAIHLITGKPGAGKSLRAVQLMLEHAQNGGQVYVCNFGEKPKIPGLIVWDDPRKWEELPPGSMLVVDEAQDFFRATRGDPPEYIIRMERIRKLGVRLVLTTQQPTYLHSHLRGLVGVHEHLRRERGKEEAFIYKGSECLDVASERSLKSGDWFPWKYPKELYDLYHSAEVHTVKKEWSLRHLRGFAFGGAALLAVFAVLYGIYRMNADNLESTTAPEDFGLASALSGGMSPALPAPPAGRATLATPEAWAAALAPRLPSLPGSAPIFDGREPVAEPRVFCAISHHPGGDRCMCHTEQGTRYAVDRLTCETLALYGRYDPFLQPAPVERVADHSARAADLAERRRLQDSRPTSRGSGGARVGSVYVPPLETPPASRSVW